MCLINSNIIGTENKDVKRNSDITYEDVHSKNNSNAKSIYNLCNYFFYSLLYFPFSPAAHIKFY